MANALGVACLMKGVGGCRLVLLPVLFLLFAWPLPPPLLNELVWQLQLWTAAVAGGLLRAVGVPALVETTMVSRPDYSFAVIENCSGFRSMELLTAIALIVRELVPGAGTRSWLVVLVAPLVAAVLNTLRIFVVVVSPNPHAVNDHLVQGILVLVAGTLTLHVCARRLCVGPRPPSAVVAVSHPERSAPAMFPWRAGMAALLALSVVSLLPSPWRSAAAPPLQLGERIPVEHAGWLVKSQQRDVQFLGAVRFRESLSRLYSRGGEAVALFVAAAAEGNRRTSPFSPKTVLPGMRWRLERSDVARLEALGIAVESAVVELAGERWLVYHWRRGDAGLLAETLRHGLAIDETPLTGGRERAVLRLATPVGAALPAERARAADTLERFTRDFREFLSGPPPPTARALRRAGDSPV